MDLSLQDLLICPACHGNLKWDIQKTEGQKIKSAAINCDSCGADYSVRDEIGMFLTPDLPREDLWEQVSSGVSNYIDENPERRGQLMDVPADSLSPADQFFRAQVLDEQGQYAEAHALRESAHPRLYTPEYLACHESQYHYVLDQLGGSGAPILDLASGLGGLVKRMLSATDRMIISSDFSPLILRRNRQWAKIAGWGDRLSFLALDARRTPFKQGSIETMTTNLGLPNIENPGDLLKELLRICAGTFMAISYFLPEREDENTQLVRQFGLDQMMFKSRAKACFKEAGWQANPENICTSPARPTPKGQVIPGAIDGLPVVDTELEWTVWKAVPNQ
jgi:uncharacterized protein YbaR (Trm112 family)